MKCSLCKYKNAVDEAIRHPNGYTVFVAMSLGFKLKDNRHRLCDEHKGDAYSVVLSDVGKKVASANLDYTPMEHIWHTPVWNPRGERS